MKLIFPLPKKTSFRKRQDYLFRQVNLLARSIKMTNESFLKTGHHPQDLPENIDRVPSRVPTSAVRPRIRMRPDSLGDNVSGRFVGCPPAATTPVGHLVLTGGQRVLAMSSDAQLSAGGDAPRTPCPHEDHASWSMSSAASLSSSAREWAAPWPTPPSSSTSHRRRPSCHPRLTDDARRTPVPQRGQPCPHPGQRVRTLHR